MAGHNLPTFEDQFGACDYRAMVVRLKSIFEGRILPDALQNALDAFLRAPCSETALTLIRHDYQLFMVFTNTPEGRQHRRTEARKRHAEHLAQRAADRAERNAQRKRSS